jgi:hypothetical protein
MRKWVAQALVPVLAAALLLAGVVALGQRARQHLAGQSRYTIAFADVECEPPAGLSRAAFLDEVQYLDELPDRLDLLDAGLAGRLARVFAGHPWVEEVQRVEVLPPRRVRVCLVYRTPVLAVPLAEVGPPARDALPPRRAVDRHGILLPVAAAHPALPVLAGEVPPPPGRPGTPWGDTRVGAAAAVAALLQPHLERLGLEGCSAEVTGDGVTLSQPRLRILWGAPPGREQPGEAAAEAKVRRLLDFQAGHGQLGGWEYDLRPADLAVRSPCRG